MSSFELSATNVFKFASLMTPFLIGFFLVLTSIINQDLKGVIYLMGSMLASIINAFFMNLIKSPRSADSSPFCNVFSFPFSNATNAEAHYDSPSMTSMFISFTIAYLCLPMIYNAPQTINYALISVLAILYVIDVFTQSSNKCNSIGASLLGTLVGFLLGAGWYGLIKSSGYDSLLYYSDFISNNAVCKRPRKQYFKCDVYKNGTKLSSTSF